jgi:hypothetical protein
VKSEKGTYTLDKESRKWKPTFGSRKDFYGLNKRSLKYFYAS